MSMTRAYKPLLGRSALPGLILAEGVIGPAWAFFDDGIIDRMRNRVNDQNNDKALLWKVERSALRPSYVFATIDSEDPRVMQLPPAVVRPFNSPMSSRWI
jgi:hypothetical protein